MAGPAPLPLRTLINLMLSAKRGKRDQGVTKNNKNAATELAARAASLINDAQSELHHEPLLGSRRYAPRLRWRVAQPARKRAGQIGRALVRLKSVLRLAMLDRKPRLHRSTGP